MRPSDMMRATSASGDDHLRADLRIARDVDGRAAVTLIRWRVVTTVLEAK